MGREKTVDGELRIRIETATRAVEKNYESALKTIEELKEKMNELERLLIKKNDEDISALNAAIDKLNDLTDSQILKSKGAWQKYEEFKRESEAHTTALPQLKEFYEECKKIEQLATDLTCYSLGHPKRKNTF
jgi:tetrahydromethanopterin S-methyltransferase subunit B